eukprot:1159015-Pelagomonas_calceolata.AAC.10
MFHQQPISQVTDVVSFKQHNDPPILGGAHGKERTWSNPPHLTSLTKGCKTSLSHVQGWAVHLSTTSPHHLCLLDLHVHALRHERDLTVPAPAVCRGEKEVGEVDARHEGGSRCEWEQLGATGMQKAVRG